MAGLLEHFGFSRHSLLAKHGARHDLRLVIRDLSIAELKAQRTAWKAARADYESLATSQRSNIVTRFLGLGGIGTTLAGGIAMLDPAFVVIGGPATIAGVAIIFASGGWKLLNARRRREIVVMLGECEDMQKLIEATLDARLAR